MIYISCGCVHNHYKILVHKLVNPSNLWDLREKRNLTCLSKIYEVYHNMNYLVVQVWPCFLNKCKNGFQTCGFYTYAHLEIEIWIITHANPGGIHGRLHLCKVKWFSVLLRYNKTLTKRLPKSDKCLLTCQSHKYVWYLTKAYLKAVSQFLSALLTWSIFPRKYDKKNVQAKSSLGLSFFWKQLIDWYKSVLNKTIKHLGQKLLVST